jgi:hypothetical protein
MSHLMENSRCINLIYRYCRTKVRSSEVTGRPGGNHDARIKSDILDDYNMNYSFVVQRWVTRLVWG